MNNRKGKNMRTGRYSYNAQQRSIVRPIKRVQKLAEGFAQNYDCAVICHEKKEIVSEAMMTVSAKEDIALAFYRACNTVFAQRGCTKLVNVSFLWPEDSEEAFMAELTGYIAALCQKEAVKLGLVTANVSSFVQKAVISVTAVGYANADFTDNDGKNQNKTLQAGSTLCMAGHAGMAGIGLLAAYGEDALIKQYTQGFIRQAQQFLDTLSIHPIKEALEDIDACIYPIQEGGVLNALWNYADGIGAGLDIDMRKIPIRQESVEISEFYGINPYQLMGDGACLISSMQPEKVCAALAKAGVSCVVIGQVTKENARVIRRDDEVRYLDKPAQDELVRIRK